MPNACDGAQVAPALGGCDYPGALSHESAITLKKSHSYGTFMGKVKHAS
jgi:hypothetical protein